MLSAISASHPHPNEVTALGRVGRGSERSWLGKRREPRSVVAPSQSGKRSVRSKNNTPYNEGRRQIQETLSAQLKKSNIPESVCRRPRLILDLPVRMPDPMPPLPGCMPRGKRFGADLIDVVTARRPAPDDPPGALDGVGVGESFPAVADPEQGHSAW
jgi:hypothetical protein